MRFKFLTLNLWQGGKLLDSALGFLKQQQADLIFLQECYNGQASDLNPRLRTVQILTQELPGYNYNFNPVFIDNREGEGKIENGPLILSKFSLNQCQIKHLDLSCADYNHQAITDFSNFPVAIQICQTQINKQELQLINVHGPVNFDGTEDDQRRLAFRDLILSQLIQAPLNIVAGDFNVQPQTKTIAGLEEKLINVFKEEQQNNQFKTTFNLQQKDLVKYPGYAQAVVDMIFVSPEIKIINKACPQVNISDHLPLTTTFQL